MVKTSYQGFAFGKIYAGFAAYARVNLREKCGRHLDIRDAAHVNCSQKAADVAHNSAAKGDEKAAAISAGLRHLTQQFFNTAEVFVFFARLKKQHYRLFSK